MPKQPDLIAAEMQGDATIPATLAEAAAQLYERSKRDPAVVAQLESIAAASAARIADATPQAVVAARRQKPSSVGNGNANGAGDLTGAAASRDQPG
jgi:hypothetical protein